MAYSGQRCAALVLACNKIDDEGQGVIYIQVLGQLAYGGEKTRTYKWSFSKTNRSALTRKTLAELAEILKDMRYGEHRISERHIISVYCNDEDAVRQYEMCEIKKGKSNKRNNQDICFEMKMLRDAYDNGLEVTSKTGLYSPITKWEMEEYFAQVFGEVPVRNRGVKKACGSQPKVMEQGA